MLFASAHLLGGTRLPPTRCDQLCSWVTHTRIDENPMIRGHDLCFDKDVSRKPPRNMRCGWLWENGSNNDPTVEACHAV